MILLFGLKMKFKTILFSASCATLTALMSPSSFALVPFQADYQFSYNGKNVGSATRLLQQHNNQWIYAFSAVARAGGMASATETSRFNYSQGKITSLAFKRTSKILIHNSSLEINFNGANKQIETKKDKKARSFAWRADVLDELNAELQVREDLKKNALKTNYYIADAKEIDARRFIRQGTEQVKTPAGTYNAIKVVMQHSKPERSTIFWLAPQLDYLPVKVTHKDEDASYGLSLTHYKAN